MMFARKVSALAVIVALFLAVSDHASILAQHSAVRVGTGATGARTAWTPAGKDANGGPELTLGVPEFLAADQQIGQIGTTADLAGVPFYGEEGITETVAEIMAREAVERSSPNRKLAAEGHNRQRILPRPVSEDPDAPALAFWPPADENARLSGTPLSPRAPQVVSTEFDGIVRMGANLTSASDNESPWFPPDTVGDVGPTQVLFVANGRIKVFSKAGVLGGLNADLGVFFTTVRNGSSSGDPKVRFDRLSQRWFVTAFNTASANNRILIAVSSGPTITNAASFTFWWFTSTETAVFLDYPTLGVDKNALYIGTNNFTGNSFTSTSAFVINKASIMGAGPLTATAFHNFHSASLGANGMITPQGVSNDDPNATDGFFIGNSASTGSRLVIARIGSPGSATPTLAAKYNLTVPIAPYPISVVSKNVPDWPIDAVGDRLLAAHIRKNKLTNTLSLWTAHAVEVNASGVGTVGGGRDGARWYQIGDLGGTPTLTQSGTSFDSAASNAKSIFMPSVAMSGQGHMALGASFAGVNDFVGIAVAGRLNGDPANATQAFTIAEPGVQLYDDGRTDPQRWGDYSQTNVDPTDNMTMWTFQEYSKSPNSGVNPGFPDFAEMGGWATRVIKLLAPPPATPASAAPAAVAQGAANVNVVITGTSAAGSGFFDPGPSDVGATPWNHIAAALTSSGVTINSITFTDPTHVTLNVTVAGGAPVGPRDVTITNPDGQFLTGGGLFSVTAGGGGGTVNLIVSALTTTPTKTAAAENQSITLNATTKNTGTGTAGSTFTRVYLSSNGTLGGDVLLGQYPDILSLGPSATSVQSASFTIPAGTPTGKWFLLAQADGGTTQAETSETDNVEKKAIQVGPDLYISKLTRSPTSGQANITDVTITVWTKNQVGAANAEASTTKVFYSQDGVLDGSDTLLITRGVAALAGGADDRLAAPANYIVTIPGTATPGARFIIAMADHGGVVTESLDGTKNIKKVGITITP